MLINKRTKMYTFELAWHFGSFDIPDYGYSPFRDNGFKGVFRRIFILAFDRLFRFGWVR